MTGSEATPAEQTSDAGHGAGGADAKRSEQGPAPASRLRVLLVGVCALVVVVGLVMIGIKLVQQPGSLGDRIGSAFSREDQVQAQREEVMSVGSQFMRVINTYGPSELDKQSKQMPAYRKSVEALITPKFQASFEQGVRAAEASVAQAGVERTADVSASGVSAMDSDSATVLVAGTVTNSYKPVDGKRVRDQPVPFRVIIDLVKTQGKWLVDDFSPASDTSSGSGAGGSGGTTGGTTGSTP